MEGGIWLVMGCDCDPMDNDARYGWGLRVKRLKSAFCKTPMHSSIHPPPITALITAQQILSQVKVCQLCLGESHIWHLFCKL